MAAAAAKDLHHCCQTPSGPFPFLSSFLSFLLSLLLPVSSHQAERLCQTLTCLHLSGTKPITVQPPLRVERITGGGVKMSPSSSSGVTVQRAAVMVQLLSAAKRLHIKQQRPLCPREDGTPELRKTNHQRFLCREKQSQKINNNIQKHKKSLHGRA